MTVADRHNDYAEQLAAELKKANFLCDVDDTSESVGKKVRNAQLMQYNYMLTVGDKELENRTISVRTRDNVVHGELQMAQFIEAIEKESREKSLTSYLAKEEAKHA